MDINPVLEWLYLVVSREVKTGQELVESLLLLVPESLWSLSLFLYEKLEHQNYVLLTSKYGFELYLNGEWIQYFETKPEAMDFVYQNLTGAA